MTNANHWIPYQKVGVKHDMACELLCPKGNPFYVQSDLFSYSRSDSLICPESDSLLCSESDSFGLHGSMIFDPFLDIK